MKNYSHGLHEVTKNELLQLQEYFHAKKCPVFNIADSVNDRAQFFANLRRVFPLSPQLQKNEGWDALADSLWSGIDNLACPEVLVTWQSAQSLMRADLEAYKIAKSIFADICKTLADSDFTDGNATSLIILEQVSDN